MGHFVNASELAELCTLLRLTNQEGGLILAAEAAGEAIAEALGVEFLDATNEPACGGPCANFGPKHQGQKCPEALKEFDPSSDWASI